MALSTSAMARPRGVAERLCGRAMTDDDYYTIRTGGIEGDNRPRPLRVAVMFAAGALAVTLVAVPMVRDQMERTELASRPLDLDMRAVGSIGERPRGAPRRTGEPGVKRYVVRRSVLSGEGVCIIRGNGPRTGDC